MNRIKCSILFLALTFPAIIYGQYSNFDLSKYSLPDIKINRLDASLNVGNSANNQTIRHSNSDSTVYSNSNFNGALNLDYYHFRNSEKYQGSLEVNGDIYTNPYKNKDSNYNSKSDNTNGNFGINSINRFYNQNRNFIEVDPDASLNTVTNRSRNEFSGNNSQYSYSNQYTTNLSIPISVGHGRIELVEDLRLAIYILEELNKVGRIDSLPSENVVLEMAKEISKIKRKRFFDTRVQKIAELQVLDSFLLANKIVSSNDITYFAILNDQWDYASGPPRSSGFAINAGIDDNLKLDRSFQESAFNGGLPIKNNLVVNNYNIGGFILVRYAKPINLSWQMSATFKTSYVLEFTRNPQERNNSEENYRTNILQTNLQYIIQFLPNSRTSLGLTLSGDYNNLKGDRTQSDPVPLNYQMKDRQLTVNAGFNMYYYISPQLRLQIISNLSNFYHFNLNNDNSSSDLNSISNTFHNDFSLTLIYSFF
jgi:hypothetical protein